MLLVGVGEGLGSHSPSGAAPEQQLPSGLTVTLKLPLEQRGPGHPSLTPLSGATGTHGRRPRSSEPRVRVPGTCLWQVVLCQVGRGNLSGKQLEITQL